MPPSAGLLPLLRVPYGTSEETRSSTRYHLDCAERGDGPFVTVQWTLRGEGQVILHGKKWPVPRHHAFVAVIPETMHYGYPPQAVEPWTFAWLNFYGEMAIEIARRFRSQFGPVAPLAAGSPAALALRELIGGVEERRARDSYEISEVSFGFWTRWWKQLDQPTEARGGVVESVVRHCRDHFRDPITVKELATRAGVSREHLTREFRRAVGLSPALYLRRQRAEAAARLMRHSNWSFGEIAMRSGFRSARQCREAVRQRYRRSPASFRSQKIR